MICGQPTVTSEEHTELADLINSDISKNDCDDIEEKGDLIRHRLTLSPVNADNSACFQLNYMGNSE